MKRFVFRLQKVLDYRFQIENKKKLALAEQISLYNQLKEKIEEGKLKKNSLLNKISKFSEDPVQLHFVQQCLTGISQTFINSEKEMEEVQKKIDIARLSYLEAKKQREIFEKLKEKAYEEFKYNQKREEQKQIDEFSRMFWEERKVKKEEEEVQ
ncbi:MAG TPA: flagellar export protein FliJ [Spirochaetia bacterium]|nr:MAG: flagellar export protein FliJ [Spirochaetes bacterium GWB1_36_13]HCL57252.1 flagellar export protein FliJ [Spirochaetia bacterium]